MTIRKNYRLGETTLKMLDAIGRYYKEVSEIKLEGTGIKVKPYSQTEVITMLIQDKYKELKEQGYDLK